MFFSLLTPILHTLKSGNRKEKDSKDQTEVAILNFHVKQSVKYRLKKASIYYYAPREGIAMKKTPCQS